MIGKLLKAIDGWKTYLFIIAWGVYKLGVGNGWWGEIPTLEVVLISGAGVALREGVAKAEKK